LNPKSLIYASSPAAVRGLFQRIEASPLGSRLARGAFWSLAGSLISRGLGLLSAILVGRLLGKEGFGELGIIQNTIGMFGTLAGFGMGLTANKHVAEFKRTDPARAGRILGLASATAWVSSGLMGLALIVSAPWLAARTLAAPHLSGLLQIGAMLLFLSGINGAQTGALSGFEAFKAIARINLISGVLTFPLMVAGAWYWGVTGAVWGLIGSQLTNCLLCFAAVRGEAARFQIPIRFTGALAESKLFWSFSFPAVLSGILSSFVTWTAGALLVNQLNGYAEMGVYNAVMRIKCVPELLLSIVMAPLLPVLSEQFGTRATQAYNTTLRYAFGLSVLFVVPFALFQIAVPSVTLLPFGKQFSGESNAVVGWLMLHSAFYGVFFPFSAVLPSMNRTWFAFIYVISYSLTLLALSSVLIPRHGAAGFAAATTISYVATSLLCVAYIYRYEKSFVGEVVLWRSIIAVTASAVVCALSSHFLNPSASAALTLILCAGFVLQIVRRVLQLRR